MNDEVRRQADHPADTGTRKEIDLLEWSALRWNEGVIRVEPTAHFAPKSESSIGDVQVDPEVLEVFRGFRAKAEGEFVIQTAKAPKPGTPLNRPYKFYRCDAEFKRLSAWLRRRDQNQSPVAHLAQGVRLFGLPGARRLCRLHGVAARLLACDGGVLHRAKGPGHLRARAPLEACAKRDRLGAREREFSYAVTEAVLPAIGVWLRAKSFTAPVHLATSTWRLKKCTNSDPSHYRPGQDCTRALHVLGTYLPFVPSRKGLLQKNESLVRHIH